MPLDADLLDQAKKAESRVIDAEQAADIARLQFHAAVRRLQLAGASMREIAEALGLSHQRIHQIVAAAGGSRRWRRQSAGPGELRSCSFCGRGQKQVKVLIAGTGACICDGCITRMQRVLAEPGRSVSTPTAVIEQVANDARTERCSFCGKQRHQVRAMASAGGARFCDECLELCQEIRRERLN